MKSLTHKAIVAAKFVGLFSILIIYDRYQQINQHQESEESQWMTSYTAAIKKAELEDKSILIHFTSLDPCVDCHDQENELFSHPAFISFAQENLVLLRLSHPEYLETSISGTNVKYEQEGVVPQQNVHEKPMILILDKKGNYLTEAGLPFEGVHAFIGYVSGSISAL